MEQQEQEDDVKVNESLDELESAVDKLTSLINFLTDKQEKEQKDAKVNESLDKLENLSYNKLQISYNNYNSSVIITNTYDQSSVQIKCLNNKNIPKNIPDGVYKEKKYNCILIINNNNLKFIDSYEIPPYTSVEFHNIHSQSKNEILNSLLNNDPIDEYLHVIMVISNPVESQRRIQLAKEFITRMEHTSNVILYIVELCYSNQNPLIVDINNPKHLLLETNTAPLWHKENMINIGVKKLLPNNWKAFAWIDADLLFENTDWVLNTLKILNGYKDVVQLFDFAYSLDIDGAIGYPMTSFAYRYILQLEYNNRDCGNANDYYMDGYTIYHSGNASFNTSNHCGYAWAMTRKAFEKIGGLYDLGITGHGDLHFACSVIGQGPCSIYDNCEEYPQSYIYRGAISPYKRSITEYAEKAKSLRLGYVPNGVIHFFHGHVDSSHYENKWKITIKHDYDPYKHIIRLSNGLIAPSIDCPEEMIKEISDIFYKRLGIVSE